MGNVFATNTKHLVSLFFYRAAVLHTIKNVNYNYAGALCRQLMVVVAVISVFKIVKGMDGVAPEEPTYFEQPTRNVRRLCRQSLIH